MDWLGSIVLFSIFFFVVLLVILPRGVQTQAEAGEVEPGTPPGAPAAIRIWRKFLWAGVGSGLIVVVLNVIINYELITLEDVSFLIPDALLNAPGRR